MYLSNYSSESDIANSGKSVQQDDIFNETKTEAQLDTIRTPIYTVTSNGDCNQQ